MTSLGLEGDTPGDATEREWRDHRGGHLAGLATPWGWSAASLFCTRCCPLQSVREKCLQRGILGPLWTHGGALSDLMPWS